MRICRRQRSTHQVFYELSEEKEKQQKELPSSWIESVPSKHAFLRAGIKEAGNQRSREAGTRLGERGKGHMMSCGRESVSAASLKE